MKTIHKWMLTALLFAGISPAFAQDNDSTKRESETNRRDTTEISWRKKKFVIISDDDGTRFKVEDNKDHRDDRKKRDYSHVGFMALDFGVNNYYSEGSFGKDALEDPRLEVRSFRPFSHVGLHFLPTTASLIGRGAVNLQTAISIDYPR